MTTNHDFDRHAAAFLADGPTELADRVLDAALSEVHLTRQRRGPAALWRFPRMHTFFRLQTAALVAVVLIGGALVFISPRLGPSGTVTTPPPTAMPTPVGTASCGHELARGLYLTAGCEYQTSNFPPSFTIVSDGHWQDGWQSPGALDFYAITGPAVDTTVRLRTLRTVPADPCNVGSLDRRPSTPATSREYVDWLGAFISEPTDAVKTQAFGLEGWRFDFGGDGLQTFDPNDPCAIVDLSEPSADEGLGSAETLAVERNQRMRVYVMDTEGAVLLVTLSLTDAESSEAAGDTFLAGLHVVR